MSSSVSFSAMLSVGADLGYGGMAATGIRLLVWATGSSNQSCRQGAARGARASACRVLEDGGVA
jgi:hypothetical protein